MSDDGRFEGDVERYLKTTFVARVAHDIRGPAGVTLTAVDELENALGPAASREHAALLGILKRSSRRILRVAEKLSRSSEAAQGPTFQVANVRVRPIVERAVREAESVEGRRNVAIEVQVDPAFDRARDTVSADASWLETLLVEIVSNALKHARSHVAVRLEDAGEEVVVTVLDDGRGAAPKVRSLYEPSSERNGLGLSLSLADLAMRAQGGGLTVSSRETGGSAVSLRLPKAAAAGAAAGQAKAKSATEGQARARVLVVDDDTDTVELVAYALERAGLAPISARTLAEARALIQTERPDAMISDLSLPDGSGADLIAAPGAELIKTKILVSGHSGAAVERHAGAQGFDHRMVKPVDIDELVRTLFRSLAK